MVDRAAIKAELEAKLNELIERATEIEGRLSDPGNSDWEENALESEGDEVLVRVGDVTKKEIQEIRQAISLIESGQYGTCIACGKAISRGRLEAMPYATKCIECAEHFPGQFNTVRQIAVHRPDNGMQVGGLTCR